MRKIVIVGTAPGWEKAPFDDASVEIWATPGVVVSGTDADRCYEIHGSWAVNEGIKDGGPQFIEKCKGMGDGFVLKEHHPYFPDARIIQPNNLYLKFRKYFGCTIAWMLAEAILEKPDQVAIYGVNAADKTEYAAQKPSITYFVGFAEGAGIDVKVAEDSELFSISHQYGIEDVPPMMKMLQKRKAQVSAQKAQYDSAALKAELTAAEFNGMIKAFSYIENNFGHSGMVKED